MNVGLIRHFLNEPGLQMRPDSICKMLCPKPTLDYYYNHSPSKLPYHHHYYYTQKEIFMLFLLSFAFFILNFYFLTIKANSLFYGIYLLTKSNLYYFTNMVMLLPKKNGYVTFIFDII